MSSGLTDIRLLGRKLELLEHNAAVVTRELLSGGIVQEEELHPSTPPKAGSRDWKNTEDWVGHPSDLLC